MKKIIALLLVIFMLTSFLVACSANEGGKGDKISVVVTMFPEYDWVMQIVGEENENVDVTMLLDSGVDLHSYQPSVDDIVSKLASDSAEQPEKAA